MEINSLIHDILSHFDFLNQISFTPRLSLTVHLSFHSWFRISTGSQTSELEALADKKKKKGVKAMFSKLTKSRSIEDSSTGGSIIGAGVKVRQGGKQGKRDRGREESGLKRGE